MRVGVGGGRSGSYYVMTATKVRCELACSQADSMRRGVSGGAAHPIPAARWLRGCWTVSRKRKAAACAYYRCSI